MLYYYYNPYYNTTDIGAGFLLESENPYFEYALQISVHGRFVVSRRLLVRPGRSGMRHTTIQCVVANTLNTETQIW